MNARARVSFFMANPARAKLGCWAREDISFFPHALSITETRAHARSNLCSASAYAAEPFFARALFNMDFSKERVRAKNSSVTKARAQKGSAARACAAEFFCVRASKKTFPRAGARECANGSRAGARECLETFKPLQITVV